MGERVRSPRIDAVIITCEHGGNRVPRSYERLFQPHGALLASHRGWDPGALELARRLARARQAPLFYSTTTRLLVELNRSTHHRSLFSVATRKCPRTVRDAILERYYRPYRASVESAIAERIRHRKALLHVSVHTFTPILNGQTRRADVGLLYDPKREAERRFAARWRAKILAQSSASPVESGHSYEVATQNEEADRLRVRLNYPYRGSADGFTTYLRGRFPASRYLGLELEVNQRFVSGDRRDWQWLQNVLVRSLGSSLARRED